eukprot:GFUD01082642.1.p1 GENE.GFUD01082642.1~~GFUD01082642.1.p1  ORF type:complete len:347 (-),score=78.13 GFUD01082642.1:9-1049(-)
MACCGSCLRVSGYVLAVLIAVLVFFYVECEQEKEEALKKVVKEEFRPEETDVDDVPLGFCQYGETLELHMGIEFTLIQSVPCALVKLIKLLTCQTGTKLPEGVSIQNVTIYDARKNNPGSFHETGFTLVELEEDPVTTDWRTSEVSDENADIKKFHKQMDPIIKQMYPDAKKIIWTYNVVRGGDKFGDQPKAVNGPHLDYHQNDTARIEFHKEFPALDMKLSEPAMLMGSLDDEDGKLGVMLGVWKPIQITSVCDYPLAVMDARTFYPDNQSPNKLHINFGVMFHNLNGAISYSPDQKWYYYPFQTPREVLIFHQYSKGRWFANPVEFTWKLRVVIMPRVEEISMF